MTLEQIREMLNNIASDNIPEPIPFWKCTDALLAIAEAAEEQAAIFPHLTTMRLHMTLDKLEQHT